MVRPSVTTWPVSWSAIWVGALSGLAMALILGLTAIALGAHQVGPARPVVDLTSMSLVTLIFSVIGAFISAAVGGWVTGQILGTRRAEPAMLHGAIAWLVTIPILLILGALGVGSFFGAWYGGLAGTPVWVTSTGVAADPNAAIATRNAALGAVTALLLGLVGSVVGGWLASEEPMTLTHYRTRDLEVETRTAA
jgi:hypothetical protein